MTALWWIGLALALLGAMQPQYRERTARRMAAIGVALLVLNAVHVWVGA